MAARLSQISHKVSTSFSKQYETTTRISTAGDCLHHAQQVTLTVAATSTPVLRYYNLNKEVTLQYDTSQAGLGAAQVQNEQPVAYASRALTEAETRYVQIERVTGHSVWLLTF